MAQHIVITFIAFFISMLCGFLFIPRIMNFCIKKKLYDIPNKRKVHKNAIPRLGGICFLPSMAVAFIIAIMMFNRVTGEDQITIGMWSGMFLVSLTIIYTVGIIDDIIGLRPKNKFFAQILAASLLPISGLYINDLYGFFGIHEIPFWIGCIITVFLIVFIDNAMNLIDGIDGLSGGLTLISLAGFLFCFSREGMWVYCILIAGLMGVIISFLYFNVWGDPNKGHKIFMGDSGSLTLGFILGFLMIKFAMNNPNVMPYRNDSLLLSYTLLIVPCFDVVRVSFKRLRNHQSIFQADKNHIHHKFMRCGLSQHSTLLAIIVTAIGFILLNYALYSVICPTLIVVIDVVIYTTMQLILDFVMMRHENKLKKTSI